MSITVTYYRLPSEQRDRATRDQVSWEQFRESIQSAYFESFHSAMAAMQGFNGGQEERLAKIDALLLGSRDPRRFDMEKDWHIVGYLLTGSAEIVEEHRSDDLLHNVIFGGYETAVTTGDGAVRYYDEQVLAQSCAALGRVDRELVGRRFDPARMAELDIYAAPEESERDGIFDVLDHFIAFFREAAFAGENIIKFAT